MANKSALELAVETGKWDSGLNKAKKALENFTESSGGLQQALDKDSAKMGKFVQIMGKTESTAKTAKGQMNDYKNTIEQLTMQYNRMTDAQKKSIGQDYLQVIDKLKQKYQEVNQEAQNLSRSLESTTGKGGFGQLMSGVAGKFGISASMFTGVGAAIAGAGAAFKFTSDNIKTAMNFERSMSQLSSLTGMVGKDLEKLKNYAIDLGSTSTLTASQVADAFRLIGSQQPQLLASGEALKEVTQYAITLSEAAGIDLTTAAQTLSTSINQMGGDSANAERYVNVLAAASQKGAGDIAWLGEAITKSATAAKAVGTDYEELVANLEQLAKGGFDASTAGTALRSIIMNLEKQTNEKFKPSVVGLTQAFDNLAKEQLDITGYQDIVGKMFASQAKVLAEAAGEAKNLQEAITGTNIAEEQAKTNTDNLDGSLKSLSSAWEGLNLHINDSNGFLRDCVDWLKEVIVWADQTFTAAGRAAKQLERLRGGGNGQPSVVDQQIDTLNGYSSQTQKWGAYRSQVGAYNNEINELNRIADALEAWRSGGQRTEEMRQLVALAWEKYKATDASVVRMTAANVEAMRDEYQKRGRAAIYGNQSGTAPSIVQEDENVPTPTPTHTTPRKTTVKEVRELTGLLEIQQKKVKDLQTQIAQAPTETMITYLQGDLKVAQDELDRLQGKVKEVNGEGLQLVTTETRGTLEILEDQLKTIQESMKAAITPEDYAEMLAAAADVQEQIKAFKGENKKETKTVNLSQEIGNIVSGISGMTSSIEQLGIELPEGMKDVLGGIQSMVNILTSIGTIVSAIEAISAADIITPFARGGVVHAAGGYKVPGNHYSGDNIPALLDAGEVVLNRAQAASLASDLQSGVGAGGYRPSYISGEQIFLVLNRYTKRTGKGELVTWRD